MDRKDDILPVRFSEQPLKRGASEGLVANTAEMLDEYYKLRGWDPKTGWPSKGKLYELSLGKESEALSHDNLGADSSDFTIPPPASIPD
jgi:aldehyde:ferredoxin oxidoreductase